MSEQHTPPPYPEDLQLIDASSLGKLIGRSTKSIKIDANRRPETLPPRFVIPGTRKVQWRVADVRRWMEALAAVEENRRLEARRLEARTGIKLTQRQPVHLGRRDLGAKATAQMNKTEASNG